MKSLLKPVPNKLKFELKLLNIIFVLTYCLKNKKIKNKMKLQNKTKRSTTSTKRSTTRPTSTRGTYFTDFLLLVLMSCSD